LTWRLKILHITEYCHAGSVGGTERYILDLTKALTQLGHSSAIGWLTAPVQRAPITEQGVRILPLPAPPMRVDAALPGLTQAALQLLHAEKPDLLHFHTFGFSEALLARMGREHGIPYAFTYHSPAWTCRRETLLYRGAEPCDGEVRPWRCSACQSEERLGGSWMAANAATAGSLAFGWPALTLGRNSLRRRTAFYYDTLRYRRALRHFLSECDLVISCCDWSTPLLVSNGARPETVRLCPQGVSNDFLSALEVPEPRTTRPDPSLFTVGYVGRLTPVKGIHILVDGFARAPEPRARLRVVGWEPEKTQWGYARGIESAAKADPRIELVPKAGLAGTIGEYRRLDMLAIPSVWMETGPLTLYEGLALNLPVYGSCRIGQLKLLREHGTVVEPNTPESWRSALVQAFDRHRNSQISRGPTCLDSPRIRTMLDVAVEMDTHYRSSLNVGAAS
jgi:glycosyltransferase involved in cell wall biosynthesis